jgi:glycosyltransferase involved in cell wall biosynthesis
MRILILHNHYQQSGGEDAVVSDESELLRERGHDVRLIEADNRTIGGALDQLSAALSTIYSSGWRSRIRAELVAFRPHVVHVHNFFPLMSPSVYMACSDAGVAVVQTLHNYRLVCPGALLARQSSICELCIGKSVPWPAVRHACYRGSRGATAATAAMLAIHRARGTWQRDVQAYVALTEFGRGKFVSGGYPADRIHVKPNFAKDCGTGDGDGGYFLFVGRLSAEKGILALLQAYRTHNNLLPLKIVGSGPLEDQVRAACAESAGITWLGKLSPSVVRTLMQSATAVACPSECYEAHPMVAVESLSAGTPVIAPRLGAFIEMVSDFENGLMYDAFDTAQLGDRLRYASEHPAQMRSMRGAARTAFEQRYSADVSYRGLMQIYEKAMQLRRSD